MLVFVLFVVLSSCMACEKRDTVANSVLIYLIGINHQPFAFSFIVMSH